MANNEVEVDIVAKLTRIEKQLDDFTKKAQKKGEDSGEAFAEGLDKGIGKVKDFFNADGIEGAIGNIKSLGLVAGAAAAGFMAIKTAIDLAFEGEKLKAIEAQFDTLTKRAGASGVALQAAFEEAAGGMVDTTDIMRSANKALIELSDNANDLPQIFEIARKATVLFGGEVTDNFEKINQAIASGNTRSLRQLGIFIDQDKALRDYAQTMHVTVDELSQFGRQQAILAAVMEQGKKNLEDINPEIAKNASEWQKAKVNLHDFLDEVSKGTDSVIGPAINSWLTTLNRFFEAAKKGYAEGSAIGARGGLLAQDQGPANDSMNGAFREKAGAAGDTKSTDIVDQKKIQEEYATLHALINQNEGQLASDRSAFALAHNDFEGAQSEGRVAIAQQEHNELTALNEKYKSGQIQSSLEFELAQGQIHQKSEQARLNLQEKIDKQKAANVKSTFGIIATLSQSGNETLAAIGKAAGIVQIAIDTPIAVSNAFKSVPFPFNFVAAGLVGVAMAAQAAQLAGIGTSGGGGGGGASIPSAPSLSGGGVTGLPSLTEETPQEERKPSTNVQVVVQGNILDRRQTGLELAEVINEAFGSDGVVFATA